MGRTKGAKNHKGTSASRTKEAQLKIVLARSTDGTPRETTSVFNWITTLTKLLVLMIGVLRMT